jgi:excisionase family DNA binding protein
MPPVGQERQDWPGHSSGQRASVREAAELLGTTVDAIRKRVQRGTIPYEKDSDGRVWIVLDAVQDPAGHRQDTDQPQSDNSALISAKDETIAALHDQLEAERQAHAEARRIMAGLVERIPAIEAPQEPSEDAETVDEEPERAEPRSATVGAQEGARRPWWRRIVGR